MMERKVVVFKNKSKTYVVRATEDECRRAYSLFNKKDESAADMRALLDYLHALPPESPVLYIDVNKRRDGFITTHITVG